VVGKATSDASRNAQQTNQAATSAAQGVNSDAAAGVNTGSISQTKADGGVYSPPSYDLSKVNLSGYAGPTDTGARFNQAAGSAATAGKHAAALASGQVQQNAFDNALATQTPNWGKVLGAVGAENQAVQNAGAQQAGAQERINQATGQSDVNVAKQKADLGDASKALSANAAATQKALQGYTAGLSSDDRDTLGATLDKLRQDPSAAAALGLTTTQVAALLGGLTYGFTSPQQVQQALSRYASAAQNATGYTADSASQQNRIGQLLSNGQAPAVATAPGTGSVDLSGTQQRHAQDFQTIEGDLSRAQRSGESVGQWASTSRSVTALNDLLQDGYTPEQIGQMLGVSPDVINTIVNRNGKRPG
jgi:hypothetical protein